MKLPRQVQDLQQESGIWVGPNQRIRMSETNLSYTGSYDADTFASSTSTEQSPYGTDTFEFEGSHGSASPQPKSYETDTFVAGTVSQDSQKYSDTFESTLSSSQHTFLDSQSTVIESPRKSLTHYSYSTESFERSSHSGSRYTSFESSSERTTYSDTFEESRTDEETETWTKSVSEDSGQAEEARTAKRKFLQAKYEQMIYGDVQQEPTVTPLSGKPRSRGEKQVNTYCQRKLEMLKTRKEGDNQGSRDINQRTTGPLPHANTLVKKYGISEGTVSRLKLQNLIDRMKAVTRTEIHSPKHCKDCRHQIAQCKQDEYLKLKTAIARNKMVDEQFENLCAKDSLAIFGEMIGSLPKLSDDPEDVWEKLMKPLHERNKNNQQGSS